MNEVHFFNLHLAKGWEWYLEQMPWMAEGQMSFEKSPYYHFTPAALVGLRQMHAKVIVLVKDPFVRIVSIYHSMKNAYNISKNFGEFVIGEKVQILSRSQ